MFKLVDETCLSILPMPAKIGVSEKACRSIGGAHLADFSNQDQLNTIKKFIKGRYRRTCVPVIEERL